MNKNKKVFLVGGEQYIDYLNWVLPLGFTITEDLNISDLVFFCGGSDIFPGIYNHPVHHTTGYNLNRDTYEKDIFDKAVKLNKKMWGCCRGSQAICSYQKGGYLIQHSNHPSSHLGIIAETGEKLRLTSSHHQMAGVTNLNHKILVYADNLSNYHYLGSGEDIECKREPEITYYPDINAIGSQSHVEWQYGNQDIESKKTVKYHQDLLIRLMNGTMH